MTPLIALCCACGSLAVLCVLAIAVVLLGRNLPDFPPKG